MSIARSSETSVHSFALGARYFLGGGLTVKDLQDMIQISPGPGFNRYWIDPKLVGPDGRANPQYLQVPTAPGEFDQHARNPENTAPATSERRDDHDS